MLKSLLQTFEAALNISICHARKIRTEPRHPTKWENTERGITAVCFFRRSIGSESLRVAKANECIPYQLSMDGEIRLPFFPAALIGSFNKALKPQVPIYKSNMVLNAVNSGFIIIMEQVIPAFLRSDS